MMAHTAEYSNQVGAGIGATLVFFQKLFLSISVLGFVSLEALGDASLLAAAGAVIGFIVTALMRFISRKIFKTKNHSNNEG